MRVNTILHAVHKKLVLLRGILRRNDSKVSPLLKIGGKNMSRLEVKQDKLMTPEDWDQIEYMHYSSNNWGEKDLAMKSIVFTVEKIRRGENSPNSL